MRKFKSHIQSFVGGKLVKMNLNRKYFSFNQSEIFWEKKLWKLGMAK